MGEVDKPHSVNRGIAPSFVKESPCAIQKLKISRISLATVKFQRSNLEIAPKMTEIVIPVSEMFVTGF